MLHINLKQFKVSKMNVESLTGQKYGRLISQSLENIEATYEIPESIVNETNTRRLKFYCASLTGIVFSGYNCLNLSK